MLERLDVSVVDNTLGPLSRYGRGSSFADTSEVDTPIEQTSRWDLLSNNSEFRETASTIFEDLKLKKVIASKFGYSAQIIREIEFG